ncbi:hypothetical protein BKA67DRAFT_579574 [Truncatella angustata]|uniref:Uncharacterized protein n=1 Tax=Truncatella angustata TaxID=152316 RepID=A0A9P8UDV8_9PEZI|nr:uncharacterized protein BKA67DRAFT_579574 [Truncatella angustata]KAH6648117.1 hypothetical protein BKA67DRAFT_579574 [Truncatella angustata]
MMFCDRQKAFKVFCTLDNEMTKGSYFALKEHMRFLDKGDGEGKASESISNIEARNAMTQVGRERYLTVERGWFCVWTKPAQVGCASIVDKTEELEW